jgi:hypothetical protein
MKHNALSYQIIGFVLMSSHWRAIASGAKNKVLRYVNDSNFNAFNRFCIIDKTI